MGIELLGSEKQHLSPHMAEQELSNINKYLESALDFGIDSSHEFSSYFDDFVTTETKALISQVRTFKFIARNKKNVVNICCLTRREKR